MTFCGCVKGSGAMISYNYHCPDGSVGVRCVPVVVIETGRSTHRQAVEV